MSNKEFINNLSSTYADVRRLDVKKINLKGKNILEYIEESVPTIKHAQDTRETVTENDLWGQWVETLEDGTVIIHDDDVTNPNASSSDAWNASITKVEDNKAYVEDTLYGNIQTEKIKSGSHMFYDCSNLATFTSNLSSVTDGYRMFNGCSALTSFNADLSSLTNGYYMFSSCSNLTAFDSDLPSLLSGGGMFSRCSALNTFIPILPNLKDGTNMFRNCSNLTAFDSDLSSLTSGYRMFYECTNLTSFDSDLPSLMNGNAMFYECTNLTSFTFDLSNLTYGEQMFYDCTNLTSFNSNLPSLTNGHLMFGYCTNLTSFSSDLSSLTNGDSMFYGCEKLTSFSSDLSSLTYGNAMFNDCSNLTSFTSDLSSLTHGGGMFEDCSLDAQSVMYIVHSIKDIAAEKLLYSNDSTPGTIPYVTYDSTTRKYSASKGFMSDGKYVYTYNKPQLYTTTIPASEVGKLTLGINVTNNSSTIEQQLEDFAKESSFDSWADLIQIFEDKGWTVTFQYRGTTTDNTLSEDEQFRGVPIYARLIEVTPEGEEYTEEEKASAEYCTEDGTKYYNIDWGHDVTDYDQYQYFGSLLEACGYFGVIPKKYLDEA